MAERVSPATRRLVERRAGHRCEYCQTPARFVPETLSVEHVIPRSRLGSDSPGNLALACQGCNNHKYVRVEAEDPVGGEIVPLFHPRRDRWPTHFAWSQDGIEMLGLTPTGRATVEALKLNRPGLMELRRLLVLAKLHPPNPV